MQKQIFPYAVSRILLISDTFISLSNLLHCIICRSTFKPVYDWCTKLKNVYRNTSKPKIILTSLLKVHGQFISLADPIYLIDWFFTRWFFWEITLITFESSKCYILFQIHQNQSLQIPRLMLISKSNLQTYVRDYKYSMCHVKSFSNQHQNIYILL